MKKAGIVIAVLLAVAIILPSVFVFASNRMLLLNRFFVSETDIRGVDVSNHQTDIDMQILADQGIDFIYIKATEGSSYVDSYYKANMENAKEAGLAAGAYHFFSFESPGETQAQNFIEAVGDLSGCLIPVVDFEYYGDLGQTPVDKKQVVQELTVLLDALEAEYGVRPMIYTSNRMYQDYLKDFGDTYPLWIRNIYYPVWFDGISNWTIWQYSGKGVMEGYTGGEKYIDLDVLNPEISLESLIING